MTEKPKKPIYKNWRLWLIAVVAGAGVFYLILREPAPRLPMRQALIEVVHDELGRTANWNDAPDRIQGLSVEQRSDGDYVLWLYLRADHHDDTAHIRRDMLRHAQALFKHFSTDAAFDSIYVYRITSFLRLPDDRGDSTETGAGRIVLTREAAQQIRWKSLTTDDFEALVRAKGTLRFHSALE